LTERQDSESHRIVQNRGIKSLRDSHKKTGCRVSGIDTKKAVFSVSGIYTQKASFRMFRDLDIHEGFRNC
jgi:hypothetical protein